MQAQLNFTFDLGTAAGRAELQRMFGHLLAETPAMIMSDDGSNIPAQEDPVPTPAPRRMPPPNITSIPDDPVRAAAALAGRQAAAAKARAIKAAKAATPTDDGPGNGADPGDQMVGDDDPDDMGLDDPSMSPAEAKEAGIVLVRQMYAAQKVAEVKKLQKEWGIAKFYDVPIERGHEFYRAVMAISQKVMGKGASA